MIVDTVISTAFSMIAEALARDETVTIAGFGSFSTRARLGTTGPQPRHRREHHHRRLEEPGVQGREEAARDGQRWKMTCASGTATFRRRDRRMRPVEALGGESRHVDEHARLFPNAEPNRPLTARLTPNDPTPDRTAASPHLPLSVSTSGRTPASASRGEGTFVTGRMRADFVDSSIVRTHAQSCAELEATRARVPCMARMGIAADANTAHPCAHQITGPLPT